MTKEEKQALVDEIDWYHCIDVGDGIVTPGANPHPFFDKLGLPDDMTGLDVLDIGAWDGYYSFRCEERGADVLATDSFCWGDRPITGRTFGTKAGFLLARELRGSKVSDVFITPEEIDSSGLFMKKYGDECVNPECKITFGVVLLLGVIYHMKNPIMVMQNAWNLTRPGGQLLLETHIDSRFGEGQPYAVFYPRGELCGDTTNWWGPNVNCARAMLETLDPAPAKVELLDGNPYGGGSGTMGRAIFRATK